jgi:hypothetical protein
MLLNPDRMVTASHAKPRFHQIVSDARDGRTTHILSSGAAVVAHVVPAGAHIIDDDRTLEEMLSATVAQEAEHSAKRCWDPSDGLIDAGPVLGRVLGWVWHTDHRMFADMVSDYLDRLGQQLGGTRPESSQVVGGLSKALNTCLTSNDTDEAIKYARTVGALDGTQKELR